MLLSGCNTKRFGICLPADIADARKDRRLDQSMLGDTQWAGLELFFEPLDIHFKPPNFLIQRGRNLIRRWGRLLPLAIK